MISYSGFIKKLISNARFAVDVDVQHFLLWLYMNCTVYAEGRYEECGDKALLALRRLEHEDLKEMHPYMALLHSYVGNVCIGKKDYERGLEHHNKDLDIGEKQLVSLHTSILIQHL